MSAPSDSVVESSPQPPPPDPSTRAPSSTSAVRRIVASPAGVVAGLAAGLLLVDAGGTDDGPGLCVFRRCTGGYCPGCGLTRATRHLSRGEITASWNDHPWVLLAVVQAVVMSIGWFVVRRRPGRRSWLRPTQVLIAVNVLALVLIWIIRLVDGSIPRFF